MKAKNLFFSQTLVRPYFVEKHLSTVCCIGGCSPILFFLSWFFLHFFGCDWKDFAKESNVPEWLLPLYLLIDSSAFSNLYIHGVNGWALAVSSITFLIGAFIFNGAIIGIITNSIERRVKSHEEGRIHYLKSGHYIIMGYDDMVPSIITHVFSNDKEAYVLILTSAETTEIKEKLRKSFPEEKMKRIIINYGHRVSMEAYKDIYLESAEQIYIVGNHHRSTHDAINVECVDSICRYLSNPVITQRPRRITCVFKDLDTYAAFKTSEIFGEVVSLGVEFVPYNFYTGWAKQVFVRRMYRDYDNPGTEYSYPAVYGEGITPDDKKNVHLVFVGTTNFAVAFAMEAAHILHLPNAGMARTRITFIDINADKEKDEFIVRNRHFFEVQSFNYRDFSNGKEKEREGVRSEYVCFDEADANFLDVEFEFIKGDVFSKKVQDEITNWANDTDGQYLTIFLALADQRQNFVMGMNMPDAVYDNQIPVFIRQDRSDNFVTNLRNADQKGDVHKLTYSTVNDDGSLVLKKRNARYANIYPFGMNETAYCADNKSLKRAKLINYLYCTMPSDNKFLSLEALDAMFESSLWDEADKKWQDLSVALKWSNLYNSYTVRTKLACLRAIRGIKIDDKSHDYDPLSEHEVEILAVVEHNRWNVEKLLMGFRKARKNEDKYVHGEHADNLTGNKKLFIHHDIRPFDQLGPIKDLDYEFTRYIPWIMKMTENE